MRPTNLILFGSLFYLFFAGLGYADDLTFGPTSKSNIPASIEAKLDKIVSTVSEKYEATAVVMGVWLRSKKKSYIKSFGYSDVAQEKIAKVTDLYRIGSITKTVTSTVLLQVIDEDQGKKTTLDTPLSQLFPEIKGSEKIPLKSLLNMTSGIYNYTESLRFAAFSGANPLKQWAPYDLLSEYVLKENNKLQFAPGKEFRYSNTNTHIAGMIVEKLTGKTLAEEIQKRIAEPLGLKVTSLPISEKNPENFIHGFTNDLKDVTLLNPSFVWAAGGMTSNVIDLGVFVEALAKGRLLSSKMHQQRFRECIGVDPSNPKNQYCLGAFVIDGFIGHTGGIAGYTTFAAHHPAEDISIVFMFNTHPSSCCGNPAHKIFQSVVKAVSPKLIRFTEKNPNLTPLLDD